MAGFLFYFSTGPLVNSFLLTFGPTIAPMTAASVGWGVKAVAYEAIFLETQATMLAVRSAWYGLAEDAWRTRFLRYSHWSRETSRQCAEMALRCTETNVAYLGALIAMPPFALVLANRVTYWTLQVLNLATLGLLAIIIVPILLALDAQYLLWRFQAAATMVGYQAAGDVITSTAPNFRKPPQISHLLGYPPYPPGGEASSAAAAAAAVAVAILMQPQPLPSRVPRHHHNAKPAPAPAPQSDEGLEGMNALFVSMPQSTTTTSTSTPQQSPPNTQAAPSPMQVVVRAPSHKYIAFPRSSFPAEKSSPRINTGYNLQGNNKDLIGNLLTAASGARQETQNSGDMGMGMVLEMEEEDLTAPEGEAAGFVKEAGIEDQKEWTPPRVTLEGWRKPSTVTPVTKEGIIDEGM